MSTNRFLRNLMCHRAGAFALAFVFFLAFQGKTCFATDWSAIQTTLQANGTLLPGDVLRFELVRLDLSLTVDGQAVIKGENAAFANGFIAFKPTDNGNFFVDGSLPVQSSEIDKVETALRSNTQINITAIGNRELVMSPALYWIHFEAGGDGGDLATALASALKIINNPQINVAVVPGTSTIFNPSSILPPKFLKLFDEGWIEIVDESFAFYLPRPDEKFIRLADTRAETGLGVGQSFYVQVDFNGGTNITLNIDFALRREEVQEVEDALRTGGFSITSESNNYLNDDPKLIFVHATGSGDGFGLGNTLYSAIQIIQQDSGHRGGQGW